MLGAARPPLCFTLLHLGAVSFRCASRATGTWDGDAAGCDAPVHPHNNREGSSRSGAEKPAAPQAVPGPGFEHPPAQDHVPPHQPPGPFPLPGALLLLISLPRTFRREQGRGASPRSPGPSPPLTAGLFRDVCLSRETRRAEEGEQRGRLAGSPAASQDPGASQHACRVPSHHARLVEGTCATAMPTSMPTLPQGPGWVGLRGKLASGTQVGWGWACGQGLLHTHTPPRRCAAGRGARGHPLLLPLLRGSHLLLGGGGGGGGKQDVPLLLLVQQVGSGGDTAQPPPCPHREQQGRGAAGLCATPARRDGGEPTGATQQPPRSLPQGWDHGCPQSHGDGAQGGTGKELVTLRSRCHAPGPLSSSLAPGRRHGVLQVPTLHSSGTCPQHARFPRGATRPVGRGMSASFLARTCGSSPSSTSTSWTPPPTRPSTGGSSVWRQWVSPSRWAIPL